jgi:lipopolysaccharide transport system ATP-binding protein
MSNLAIRIENVGKKYRISARQNKYRTMRETIMDRVTSPIRRVVDQPSQKEIATYEEIWALKDISFDVELGEVVGIIGHNGAGKSTLLKILSRITKPTTGYVDIYGRVGSLLEVGTGFHPELSGRENVYLNGTILSMRRSEIDRLFDEIVAFSGIEKFIDTPVKFYSSGMQVRLGFAVAAHLEAEIMLVDEVLAVGDASFKRKCLNKISEISNDGRTVLFVSHNLAAIKQLCKRVLWLIDGQVQTEGEAAMVINGYVQDSQPREEERMITNIKYPLETSKPIQVLSAQMDGSLDGHLSVFDSPTFLIDIETRVPTENTHVCLNIRNMGGEVIYWTADTDSRKDNGLTTGREVLICKCPPRLLTPGRYTVDIYVMQSGEPPKTIHSDPNQKLIFDVENDESLLANLNITYPGITAVPSQWSVQKVETLTPVN